EVDAIAAYASELERCYLIPISEVAGMSEIRLRLDPTLNNQALRIRWAHQYDFERSMQSNWLSRLGIST
ncbi:MAG TPA: group I intron-associated PD-(D/E)XK endonuclease, partial [Solirubrobacteraceae bacterium]|nr:group I intron-associated PD-(D/E)XK endonuclease [Solirubrobacteraceae bacterium]